MISAAPGFARKSAAIDGLNMTYVDEGTGDPIVFLHGNPTSSYLWRNVMPHLQGMGRLVAPDLIGMGGSDKLPDSGKGSYRFVDHARYLDGLFAHLGISRNVTLVLHDWGSALGFHWAHRHADSIKGIAFMEAIVRPLKWTDWPHASRPIFEGLRSAAGEEMVLEKNFFVERIFPGSVLREMSDEEMDHYRAPYLEAGESRRPTLTWPREIPIDGEPADVHEIVAGYSKWMPNTPFPKLFVNAEPGAILTGAQREFCRSWENLSEVTVKGSHFIQEDSPDEIGQAIRGWLGSVEDA